jgi:hypothetical protein
VARRTQPLWVFDEIDDKVPVRTRHTRVVINTAVNEGGEQPRLRCAGRSSVWFIVVQYV